MPFPTGDLEAAFQATGAPDITAYSPVPDDPAATSPGSDTGAAGPPATGHSGGHEPPARTAPPPKRGCKPASPTPLPPPPASASVEETLARSVPGAFSPAAAFGADFALTIPDTARIDTIPAETLAPPRSIGSPR